ncbi:hypothetical protein LMG31886_09750 [Xanthomonas hydrangeae]|uniref:XVIPCD domain-containing protein n=1 Tax=Xanthomonas hydrangeae TaxID=2775159 RepID=UPI001965E74A|nr:hypothetical protein LMG31884_09890 [Xanthomonas hydrangeae]CAD7714181.1 hypothetical protein LMG31884_09890 [Xanthomonas hydrangeae]CAD7722740.1 hypothetical protein LMG31887_09890 [Xanthomonas hydrangeae]CAD7722744.1 hypothetical protein LMG31887_09890 [Xanthomonas hydrangeae]CAD7723345.1 hypothetical protein LMG31885_05750 [Xanthomonas hydrangeae]
MNDPRQPSHPDHPMYQQIERGVHAIDAAHGREPDQTSARLTAALLPLAKEGGLSRVDHVLMSEANDKGVHGGENVFVVQGDPANPAHLRAHMKTEQALSTPEEQSFARAQQLASPAEQVQPAEPTQTPRLGQ